MHSAAFRELRRDVVRALRLRRLQRTLSQKLIGHQECSERGHFVDRAIRGRQPADEKRSVAGANRTQRLLHRIQSYMPVLQFDYEPVVSTLKQAY